MISIKDDGRDYMSLIKEGIGKMSDENLRLLINLSLRGLQECMTGIPVNDYDPKLIMSDKDIYNALYFMFFGQREWLDRIGQDLEKFLKIKNIDEEPELPFK